MRINHCASQQQTNVLTEQQMYIMCHSMQSAGTSMTLEKVAVVTNCDSCSIANTKHLLAIKGSYWWLLLSICQDLESSGRHTCKCVSREDKVKMGSQSGISSSRRWANIRMSQQSAYACLALYEYICLSLHQLLICLSLHLAHSTHISCRLPVPSNVGSARMTLQGSSRLTEAGWHCRGFQLYGWSSYHVPQPSSMLTAIVALVKTNLRILYTIYTSYHSVPLEDPVWYNMIQYNRNACVHIIVKSLVERLQVTCLISPCHSCSPGTWG